MSIIKNKGGEFHNKEVVICIKICRSSRVGIIKRSLNLSIMRLLVTFG